MARLTFGIEFEFMICTADPENPRPDTQDSRPIENLTARQPHHMPYPYTAPSAPKDFSPSRLLQMTVAHVLQSAGVQAVTDMNMTFLPGENVPQEQSWYVGIDPTITYNNGADQGCGYIHWGIEVASPAFFFCPAALEEVKFVCATLTKHFRIYLNTTCSVHVHVGNNVIDGFSLKTIQSLGSFLWVFEPQIVQLHPQHRRHTYWARSFRTCTLTSKSLPHPITPSKAVEIIFQANDYDKCTSLLACRASGGPAVKFSNLKKQPDGHYDYAVKRTIEFRSHTGTLDGERAVAWIETVVGFVRFAMEADHPWMEVFLAWHAAVEESEGLVKPLTTLELLEGLGLEGPLKYYGERMAFIQTEKFEGVKVNKELLRP